MVAIYSLDNGKSVLESQPAIVTIRLKVPQTIATRRFISGLSGHYDGGPRFISLRNSRRPFASSSSFPASVSPNQSPSILPLQASDPPKGFERLRKAC